MRFILPLPPSQNHAYMPRAGGGRYKSDVLRAWEDEAALEVRGWEPPKHTPLSISIDLVVPANKLRTTDLDGLLKFAIDATVGKRRDAWVDIVWCEKVAAGVGERPRMTVVIETLAPVKAASAEGE